MAADTGMALAVAFTAALAVLSLVLLAVLVIRFWRRRREGAASSRGGFVLFDVCFQDDRRRQALRPSSMGRSRWQESLEHSPRDREAAPGDEPEPDESELARWKKMFRATTRSLSTIDEGTEKGTTPITTPACCSPPGSPDRRDVRARALDMASIAVQVKP